MNVHGWKFQLVNQELSITSEQDPDVHLELSANAAFSLLDYLYQYRHVLHDAAEAETEHDVQARKQSSLLEAGRVEKVRKYPDLAQVRLPYR